MKPAVRRRERNAILQALGAGVVPKVGLQHIQVGRKGEVEAVTKDLGHIAEGGATIRFVIGRFGSGKTFFLHLASTVAQKQGFVVASADLTLTRRLHGSKGVARSLYAELMGNLATRTKPDGGALPSIVEKWVSDVERDVANAGGDSDSVGVEIESRLRALEDLVSGYDFASVLRTYYEAYHAGDDERVQSAIRWLRAEYSTKTDARRDLGVRSIIDDAGFYPYLKLFAAFVRIAGYAGLVVTLDELVVLSERLNSSVARHNNYEVILTILNDVLQGSAEGLGFVLGGTDRFLEDRRRGLFSYEALATRLAANPFARDERQDFSGPVIRLQNLSQEDLFVLLQNIRHVFLSGGEAALDVPDEALLGFMSYSSRTLGAEYFKTPRDTIKTFVQFLSTLEQNPAESWSQVLASSGVAVGPAAEAAGETTHATSRRPADVSTAGGDEDAEDDDLADFTL